MIMTPPNIKDLLISFSPSSDLFALASSDGRIKVWDALKGHLQTEFANLAPPSTDTTGIRAAHLDDGHLSLDYTCMKWLQLGGKKKKKQPGNSLLVLGTGHGDVVAVDVAAGQLRWKFSDCHPGGVSGVSFSRHNSSIYTAGVDSVVCQIDPLTGNLLSKFTASTKAISSLSISADGKILAAASAQLKIFSCSDNKKIKRFPGHPVAVRCMIFSEDGKYILSSAVGEKYIAIWKIDADKKQSACCVLSMEHPVVFLDNKCSDGEGTEGAGLYVLAVSETGLCYFWYGSNIEELRSNKPTRISLSIESSLSKNNKGLAIFAAKIQGIVRPAAVSVLVAYGSLVRPSFEKLTVQYGIDVNLEASQEGILLPRGQSYAFQKGQATQSKVTALDRANAEDAILPLPKLYNHDKKRKHSTPNLAADYENELLGPVANSNKAFMAQKEDNLQDIKEDVICMEERLREVGILGNKETTTAETYSRSPTTTLYNGSQLSFDANMPAKKTTRLESTTIQPLLKLSGRLRLIMAQIDKVGDNMVHAQPTDYHSDGEDGEDVGEDEDIDELIYGEEDQSGSDDDKEN